jgi:hypothetical protein
LFENPLFGVLEVNTTFRLPDTYMRRCGGIQKYAQIQISARNPKARSTNKECRRGINIFYPSTNALLGSDQSHSTPF